MVGRPQQRRADNQQQNSPTIGALQLRHETRIDFVPRSLRSVSTSHNPPCQKSQTQDTGAPLLAAPTVELRRRVYSVLTEYAMKWFVPMLSGFEWGFSNLPVPSPNRRFRERRFHIRTIPPYGIHKNSSFVKTSFSSNRDVSP